jgi:hypothetical protein
MTDAISMEKPDNTSPLSRLAEANDTFRKALGESADYPGRIVLTQGVAALPAPLVFAILNAIAEADAFTADDDPYGEHDFGSIKTGGLKLFWKIDYFADSACAFAAEAPETGCYRVMTVMLAEEY